MAKSGLSIFFLLSLQVWQANHRCVSVSNCGLLFPSYSTEHSHTTPVNTGLVRPVTTQATETIRFYKPSFSLCGRSSRVTLLLNPIQFLFPLGHSSFGFLLSNAELTPLNLAYCQNFFVDNRQIHIINKTLNTTLFRN